MLSFVKYGISNLHSCCIINGVAENIEPLFFLEQELTESILENIVSHKYLI